MSQRVARHAKDFLKKVRWQIKKTLMPQGVQFPKSERIWGCLCGIVVGKTDVGKTVVGKTGG